MGPAPRRVSLVPGPVPQGTGTGVGAVAVAAAPKPPNAVAGAGDAGVPQVKSGVSICPNAAGAKVPSVGVPKPPNAGTAR